MNLGSSTSSKYFLSAFGLIVALSLVMTKLGHSQTASARQPAAVTQQPGTAMQQSATAAQETKKPADGEWRTIQPSEAHALFQMPKKPRYIERTFTPVKDQPAIKVRLHMGTVNQGKTTYIFGYHDLHTAPEDAETLQKALDGAVRGSVVNVAGQLTAAPTKIRFENHMGRQFSYLYAQGDKSFVVVARVFIVGRRQYQVSCIMAQAIFDELLAAKFLNSFKLVEPESDEPPVPRIKKQ